MILNGVAIEDTFAEAFPMRATRLVVTAPDLRWARTAAAAMTGFATSVIACGCEAGIERELTADETPDGRPGVAVLLFGMSDKDVAKQIQARVGQCVLTCTGTACFSGLDGDSRFPLGNALRYFGDGFQLSKRIGRRRYWRIPVMDGEFLIEDTGGITGGVGGGNFLILATSGDAARRAAEAAVEAMRLLPNIVLPFPGGIVRSGSKVGSKYKGLIASTNDAFCPTLRGQSGRSALPPEVESVLEIVIDGLAEADVAAATAAGVRAACALGREAGIVAISAGNYGGQLGPYHFHLRKVLA
ncbi:formylmethanofuran--tetrahydromethanopterin N-formyltransferase [Benzoatithermus flavus]|uniref:Formylmethanofuran--tetrahydromethanopterin formyltransferase n=1 Tax=Benzoatithermus flavus TaxID=3108223 RepID=A0ABU8XPY0_9PROT